MVKCSAPGKMILLGEHAVVFGEPALAVAIDRRISASARPSTQYLVNGHPMRKKHHAYISAALDHAWSGPPVSIETHSDIPSGSGLGSSAAVAVACIGALTARSGALDAEKIARLAFEVECDVQGRASPTDTSTSAHGQGVLVSPVRRDGLLWTIRKGEKVWHVHHCDVPRLNFVVGYTGIHAPTGPLVAKVKKLCEESQDARKAVKRIGELVEEGVEALKRADLARLGTLMSEDHQLLNSLGVGHEALDRLVNACSGVSYGAKLTGAGGGGSMIALVDDAKKAAEAIAAAGGVPISVRVGCEGVRLEG
ncbi:MAG: mevalonate kinase [Thermoplasmata archaeon]